MDRVELESLVEQYRPDAAVLQRLGKVRLLMVVGPSGVGKSSLMKASGYPVVVGDASRPPRPGERNGIDYWFRTEAEMVQGIQKGEYLQIAMGPGGDIKGTHAESFPEGGVAVFSVVASAVPTFRDLGFADTMTAVVVPPDYDTWMQRLEHHHETPASLDLRLEEARQSYEFALQDEQSLFLLNDDLEVAVNRLHEIAAGHAPEGEQEARDIAQRLLQHLSDRPKTTA